MTGSRHHYLPQFYLKEFIDPRNPPYIWFYDKESGAANNAAAKSLGVEEHYYSVPKPDRTRESKTVEEIYKEIDGNAARVIWKIHEKEELTEEDRDHFAMFIASMTTRTPGTRENLVLRGMSEMLKKIIQLEAIDEGLFNRSIDKFEKDTGNRVPDREEFRKFFLDREYDLKFRPEFSVPAELSAALKLVPYYIDMSWTFFIAKGSLKFVTSDNPVLRYNPIEQHWHLKHSITNKNIEVTLPLSQTTAAVGCWDKPAGYRDCDDRVVEAINNRTIFNGLRWVYASFYSIELGEFVKSYRGSAPKFEMV